MSQQVTRILISFLMLPLAFMVYSVAVAIGREVPWNYNSIGLICGIAGVAGWLFLRMSWYLLWRAYITNTRRRRRLAIGVTFVTVGFTALAIWMTNMIPDAMRGANDIFLESLIFPMLGQVAIMRLYQETPAERADRLSGKRPAGVVCPACGYNLAGLTSTQCPECGRQYTLEALITAQPGAPLVEM